MNKNLELTLSHAKFLNRKTHVLIDLDVLSSMIKDFDNREIDDMQCFEVINHYCKVVTGEELPDEEHIPDNAVRNYVLRFINEGFEQPQSTK